MSSIIGIVGGRRWGDQAEQVRELVINFVNALKSVIIVIDGGANGAYVRDIRSEICPG